jgi:hypothetical protein
MNTSIFYDKYPLVFPNGAPEQGFSCEAGWEPLLDSLFFVINLDLKKLLSNNFRIICIKEKYGKLRIYCENATPYIQQTIAQSEAMSEQICAMCGEYGKLRKSDNWLKVRCDKCEKKHFEQRI